MPIASRVIPSVSPSALTSRQVAAEFRARVADGLPIRPAGAARHDPEMLLAGGYTPRYKIELFETEYYLTKVRQNSDIRFFVAYVVQRSPSRRRVEAYPRIFYKDVSLVWRAASHYVRSENENWIGKGDVRPGVENGEEIVWSAEDTTDLPLEIQSALEGLIRQPGRISTDERAIDWVLRRAPDDRIVAYRDFTGPRERAQADPRNLINRGRPIARFTRANDPTSLRFVRGFEPDFADGIIEESESVSRLYGGALRRFRILSRNRKIQYLFMAGPRLVWIVPPQATTVEIMSYGVRTIDVLVDDDLCIPGYEYHFLDESEDPPTMFSQIPEGFAGAPNELDASRADVSSWLDKLPVVREFRRKVLA
jgi:hypothetical protein